MVERTRYFFETVQRYRKELRYIWTLYGEEMLRLERYEGSAGYADEAAKAAKARDEKIKGIQTETRKTLNGLLDGMRKSAKSQSMTPPTSEQLALCQLLQMREKVTRDELEQASRTLKGCPAALSVLEEIGMRQDHPIVGMNLLGESTAAILRHIDSLADSAARICALNKPDSRGEMTERASVHHGGQGVAALYCYRIDQDVSSVEEAMARFGNVSNYKEFSAAVNG